MKKKIIVFSIITIVIAAVAGATWFYKKPKKETPDPQQKDLTGIIVPPIMHSMKGRVLTVPDSEQVVSLTLVSATPKYDYPMSRFVTASGTKGTLVAYDNFATAIEGGLQVVPISVSYESGVLDYYLAIIEGDGEQRHVASLPIGFNAAIKNVTRNSDQVTVQYAVHDKSQIPGEPPRIDTEAIFDIRKKVVLQAGRDPRNETVKVVKTFAGSYLWQKTESAEGDIVAPVIPNVYMITFNANRIEVATDCNAASADFVPPNASSTAMQFNSLVATEKFCEKTQETDFFAMLSDIVSLTEIEGGKFRFALGSGGFMDFIPKGNEVEFESPVIIEDLSVASST